MRNHECISVWLYLNSSYVVCICSCFFFHSRRLDIKAKISAKLCNNENNLSMHHLSGWICACRGKILGRMERTVEQHKKLWVESVSYGHLQPQWLLALSSLSNINILLKYIHTKCVMCSATGNFQLICPCSNFMELNQLPAE